jgi:hypothetical protein
LFQDLAYHWFGSEALVKLRDSAGNLIPSFSTPSLFDGGLRKSANPIGYVVAEYHFSHAI